MSAINKVGLALFAVILTAMATALTPESRAEQTGYPSQTSINDGIIDHLDAVSSRAFLETHPETIVLDVRTQDEIKSGFIVAAHFINFNSPHFTRRIKNLDPNKTYLIHCNDSDRSLLAFAMLKDLNFKHIIHMDGGLNAWKAAGLPVSVPY
jgi:rhodanese-related sulfurtransferase